jgi:hypothetical protein
MIGEEEGRAKAQNKVGGILSHVGLRFVCPPSENRGGWGTLSCGWACRNQQQKGWASLPKELDPPLAAAELL